MQIFEIISEVADFIWGPQMLLFIIGSGIYFSIRLKLIQFGKFKLSIKELKNSFKPSGKGNITPYQALASALSGIIGNGNIAGVATAIVMGGPGAVFWMWISSLILMATMYSESLLGLIYRDKSSDGTYTGGPMIYIQKGLGWKWLALAFAFAMAFKTLIATTSIQSNSMSIALKSSFGFPQIISCLIIAFFTWLVVIGGIKKLASTAQYLTPFMTLIYLTGAFLVLALNLDKIGFAFQEIFNHAFTAKSSIGGFAGATMMMAIRYGAARGAYSNEAGTGSVAIIHATAKNDNPVNQSLISMLGVFIDTIIICTLTALVIITTNIWTGDLNSTALTSQSFELSFTGGGYVVLVSSILFGYSTLITWCFYGEQCSSFIFGDGSKKYYRWLFCACILIGAVPNAEYIWSLGDVLNGITVIINLIGIIALSGVVIKKTREYFNDTLDI